MKKLILSGIFLFSILVAWSQNVPRQMVVVEVTTNVHCGYCPSAAQGVEDLLSNGKYVAVIEHHNLAQGADPFKTTASQARCVTLGYGGSNPFAFFDVKLKVSGGYTSGTMYPSYIPKYNTRIATTSPVEMTMDLSNTGLDYTAVIKMIKVGTITSTNLSMMFVVTQSHIPYSWMGQSILNYVNRLMLPDANGTAINFSASDTVSVTMNFSLDPTWPLEDCEVIAFVEDMNGKEALNGIKRAVVDLHPEFTASETSVLTNQPVTFTNATTGGYVDAKETYQWLFPGGTPSASTEADPTVSYADSGQYDVTLIVNRGGQIDTLIKNQFIEVDYPVGIQENQTMIQTQVSPNPSHGVFTLDVFSGKTVTIDIAVVNSINLPVFRESGISFSNRLTRTIDLSHLAKGLYFVMVETEGNKTVKKLVIN